MSKSNGSQPQTPNAYNVSQQQNSLNNQNALFNADINRLNTNTPLGSQTYQQTGTDPTTGAPIYSDNISLSPSQQALYNGQNQQNQALTGVNNSLLSQIQSNYSSPVSTNSLQTGVNSPGQQTQLNTSGIPGIPGANDLAGFTQQAQNAAYQNQTQYLDPQFQREQDQLQTQLQNSGAAPGSEAYNNAMQQFNAQKQQAYQSAMNNAVSQGLQEQQSLYGMGANTNQQLFNQAGAQGNFYNNAQQNNFSQGMQNAQLNNQASGQNLQQQLAIQNQPTNAFSALRGLSQVQMPQFGATYNSQAAPTNLASNVYNSYQGNLAGYNAGQQTANGITNGLFNLGGAAINSGALNGAGSALSNLFGLG